MKKAFSERADATWERARERVVACNKHVESAQLRKLRWHSAAEPVESEVQTGEPEPIAQLAGKEARNRVVLHQPSWRPLQIIR